MYECDKLKCSDCGLQHFCDHTEDIEHARNFRKELGIYWEDKFLANTVETVPAVPYDDLLDFLDSLITDEDNTRNNTIAEVLQEVATKYFPKDDKDHETD